MKDIIKYTHQVDAGKTRVRGWHDYRDCGKPAKYKVTYKGGRTEFVCGVHKRKIEYYMQWHNNVESITEIDSNRHCSECTHYEACTNCQMYCKALKRRITARKTAKNCKYYKSFIKEGKK